MGTGKPVDVISFLENFSRAILASLEEIRDRYDRANFWDGVG